MSEVVVPAHYDHRVEEKMRPFVVELERLDTIPGIARRTAERSWRSWALT